MSVETNLEIQCQCGSFYRYNGEAIYTSPLKYVYKCESCYHIIYAIENEKDKEYEKYYGSGKLIKRAIKKYGIINFKKEILYECGNNEELTAKEIFYIKELKSRQRGIGYNISLGGDGIIKGTKLSEETKQKISFAQTKEGYIERFGFDEGLKKYEDKITKQRETHMKRFEDESERMKHVNYGAKNGMYGKTHSEESIEKMRKYQTGKKLSPETIEKLRVVNKGSGNPMYGKGYLLAGSKNGRTKKWLLVAPDGKKEIIAEGLTVFCEQNKLSRELLERYKGCVVPLDLKIRRSESFESRKNTLGWKLGDVANYVNKTEEENDRSTE